MLKIYNTLTRKKETFQPLSENSVRMYVCGITPYDTTHLGHAFTYIIFDLLVRYLMYIGYTVTYTQNVTDINDRDNDILKRAKDQQTTWNRLADFWTNRFLSDMKALNWVMPNNYLKASEHIDAMIRLIQKIIDHGYGYVVSGSVYLDITKKSDFGKLSQLSPNEMLERAKSFEEDITNPHKHNQLDITLWRASSPNQSLHIPSFDSPWGKGRPGWHIECSAMSIQSLGEQLDIHGGGIDLIYPHHESEIAQSEGATNKVPFAKVWMHSGIMRIGGEKMSKSLGNLILINDLLKIYSANAIRWVLLSHHYRGAWDYNEDEFTYAEKHISFIRDVLQKTYTKQMPTNLKDTVRSYLDDDLQTPKVLAKILNEIQMLSHTENSLLQEDIKEILHMLGFDI